MKMDYCVMDPSGNITVLVETPVSEAEQPAAAAALMRREPLAEQVGFLSRDEAGNRRLRMAGGEFCGNAAMCAGVLEAMEKGAERYTASLCVSGASVPVTVTAGARGDGSYSGTVEMPGKPSVEEISFPGAGVFPVVRMEGISHVIIERPVSEEDAGKNTAGEAGFTRRRAEELAPVWCGLLGADALGLMFLDREKGRLTPLVYVPGAGTLCWEHSCASGTTAVGAYLSAGSKLPMTCTLTQPGGVLTVCADADGKLVLAGTVRFRKAVPAKPQDVKN